MAEEIGETKVIKLKKPIKTDAGTITELTLREPTAGDLEFAEGNSKTLTGNNIWIIARCAGIHPDIARSLSARDYKAAGKFISTFLEDAPPTGEN